MVSLAAFFVPFFPVPLDVKLEGNRTMSDEATTPVVETPATTETTAAATTPAGAQNSETPAEPMIPKSRFDEVNNRLKALEADSVKAAKAAKDAETKRLEEEGKYKELFEKQQADLSAAQQAAKANEIRLLQRDAAAQVNLPAKLADRLKGETLEEMVADAKTILAELPKPVAPNVNGANGDGSVPRNGAKSEDEKRRLADKYGVKPEFIA